MSGMSFILGEDDQKAFDELRGAPAVTAVVQRAIGDKPIIVVRTDRGHSEFHGEDWAECLADAKQWVAIRGR